MDGHVKVGGVWKKVNNLYVKVGGAWKTVNNAYAKTGGAWKQFFEAVILSGGNGGDVQQVDGLPTYNTTVGIRFNTDGSVETGKSLNGAAITWSAAGNWIDPTSAITGNEEVRFTNLTQNSGATDWTTEAAADNVWVGITVTRTWTSNKTTSGLRDFDCDFEVRDTSTSRPTGSSTYGFIINNVV